MIIKSIWSTPECDAWSRGFDYSNYLLLHSRYKSKETVTSNPVSPTTYAMLGLAFYNQMEEDFTNSEGDTDD
jgi:hypothetical protein